MIGMKAMKAWLLSLTQRERVLVLSATAVIALFIFYALIIEPIATTYEKNQRNVAAATETLAWMKSAAKEVKKLRGGAPALQKPRGKKLALGLVDRTVRKAGLAQVMKRVQPEGDSGVKVWFENVAFDGLAKWLSVVESKHGLMVSEINVEQIEDKVGLVNVRVLLDSI